MSGDGHDDFSEDSSDGSSFSEDEDSLIFQDLGHVRRLDDRENDLSQANNAGNVHFRFYFFNFLDLFLSNRR